MTELQVSARMTLRPGQLERFREQVTDCTGTNVVYLEVVVFVGVGAVVLALAVARNPVGPLQVRSRKGAIGYGSTHDPCRDR
jgi:hypothetical protein